MAVTVAELQIKFDAETKLSEKKVNALERRVTSFSRKTKTTVGAAATSFNQIGTAVSRNVGTNFLVGATANVTQFGTALNTVRAGGFFATFGTAFANFFGKSPEKVKQLAEETQKLATRNKELERTFRRTGIVVPTTTKNIAAATKGTKLLARGFDTVRVAMLKLLPLLAGLAALLGPVFLALGTKKALAFGDSIAQTANKIGFGVDALQELRFAAEQTGVAQNTLDLALQRFSRRVGEATVGTGEAKKALEEMGIVLKDTEGNFRGNEVILADVAEALKETGTSSDRLRLAFKLFDSEGAGLVNLLGLGEEALAAFRKQAVDLGVVLDRDLIASTSALNSELQIQERILDTNLKEAFIGLGPTLIVAAKLFANIGEVVADVVASFQDLDDISLKRLQDRATETLIILTNLQQRRISPTANLTAIQKDVLDENIKTVEANLAEIDKKLDERIKRRKREDEEAAKTTGGATGVETPEQSAARKKLESEQKSNLQTLLDSNRDILLARIAAIEPLEAEIAALGILIDERQKLSVSEGEATEAQIANVEALGEERTRLQKRLGDARTEEIELTQLLEQSVENVAIQDAERVGAILDVLAARLAEAQGIEDTADAVATALRSVREISLEGRDEAGTETADPTFDLFESVAGATQRGVLEGLSNALTGDGVDIMETFSGVFADIFDESMNEVLDQLVSSLKDAVSNFAEGLSESFSGLGEGFGAGIGAAIGIAGTLLTRSLSGTDVRANRANIQSAVTSTQQVRGVAGGNQNIAIGQVANGIADAMVPVVQELRLIVTNTQKTAANTARLIAGGGSLGGFDPTASETLGG